MSTPVGAVAKMAIGHEATYGTPATIGASDGWRMYYDSFTDETTKTPIDLQEISGLSSDYTEFEEGAIIVGGSLTYSVRYSGIHAFLMGLAMGTLSTDSGPTTFAHTAALADDIDALTMIHQVPKTNNSTFVDNNLVGMKVSRMTWSHRAGDVMKCRADFIGSYVDYDTSAATMPTGAGRTPTEPFVSWHHREADSPTIAIHIQRDSGSDVTLDVASWEITLDNAIERYFLIQNGRKSAEPTRIGFREITARMEIEQNAGWEEFMTAYGFLNTDTTEDFSVRIDYQDPAAAANSLLFELSNCRTLNVPRAVATTGRLLQTVEMRAHYETGSSNMRAEPLQIVMTNSTEGVYDDAF